MPGVIDAFARVVRPFMRWLFPEVPDGHPAQGAMLMNFAANMLGLDNAATPMGLKAMEELQTLNPVKDTATNSMAQFLAINCGSITLIPFTIIGFRALRGSHDPAGIIGGCLLASSASVVAGIAAARWLSRSPKFQGECGRRQAEAEAPVDEHYRRIRSGQPMGDSRADHADYSCRRRGSACRCTSRSSPEPRKVSTLP